MAAVLRDKVPTVPMVYLEREPAEGYELMAARVLTTLLERGYVLIRREQILDIINGSIAEAFNTLGEKGK